MPIFVRHCPNETMGHHAWEAVKRARLSGCGCKQSTIVGLHRVVGRQRAAGQTAQLHCGCSSVSAGRQLPPCFRRPRMWCFNGAARWKPLRSMQPLQRGRRHMQLLGLRWQRHLLLLLLLRRLLLLRCPLLRQVKITTSYTGCGPRLAGCTGRSGTLQLLPFATCRRLGRRLRQGAPLLLLLRIAGCRGHAAERRRRRALPLRAVRAEAASVEGRQLQRRGALHLLGQADPRSRHGPRAVIVHLLHAACTLCAGAKSLSAHAEGQIAQLPESLRLHHAAPGAWVACCSACQQLRRRACQGSRRCGAAAARPAAADAAAAARARAPQSAAGPPGPAAAAAAAQVSVAPECIEKTQAVAQ